MSFVSMQTRIWKEKTAMVSPRAYTLTELGNFFSYLCIFFGNVTIWFDSYLSEWVNIFQYPDENEYFANCTKDKNVVDFIEDTEPFLNPMMIEFCTNGNSFSHKISVTIK